MRRAILLVEKATKEAIFDCRMCGQCVLHGTGLTCPMRCPKNLRNGPCGGVLQDGNCEVLPDQPCIWVLAWKRSRKLPLWRSHMEHVGPPVDWRLQGTSSWINFATRRDRHVPSGWRDRSVEEAT
jgi:Methylene-tetrahydrofolate reductase C terminal